VHVLRYIILELLQFMFVSIVYVCLVTADVNVLVSCIDLQQLHSGCLHLLT